MFLISGGSLLPPLFNPNTFIMIKKIILLTAFVGTFCTMSATDYYISPTGKDTNSGLKEKKALQHLGAAMKLVKAGDNVYILPGTYKVQPDEIQFNDNRGLYTSVYHFKMKGQAGSPIRFIGVSDKNGQRPVFDFTAVRPEGRRITGFQVSGDYLVFRNFETVGIQNVLLKHSQSENFRIENGNHCTIDNVAMHDGMGIGIYIVRHSAYNLIINCDAYNNYDSFSEGGDGGNSDGFGAHVGSMNDKGNIFVGCRAWWNSDDGYDLINCFAPVKFEYCIAYRNGASPDPDGTIKGRADGNGFKAGGYGMTKARAPRVPEVIPMHEVTNCIAMRNGSNGIYSNHHLGGVWFHDNTSVRNGRCNYHFVCRRGASVEDAVDINGYGHKIERNLSYRVNWRGPVAYLNGDADSCQVVGNSFKWNKETKKWVDDKFTDADFESVDENDLIVPRNANGTFTEQTLRVMRPKHKLNYGADFSGYKAALTEARKTAGAE